MDLIEKVIYYFTADPLRLLYLLGGSGGLWFWIDKWRDRVRIRIRVIDDRSFISVEEMNKGALLGIEAENMGGRSTSLDPTVTLSGYTPNGELRRYQGAVVGVERDLPPHKPKVLSIEFPEGESYASLLFRTYTFKLTRGRSKRLLVWSASQRVISRFRYAYEVSLFRIFGRYNEPTP